VARIDELERIDVAGVHWRPIRRRLGVQAFGINGYSADAGELLIEAHDETGSGAGAHEELYVVVTGHARFTVAGEEIDAPAGTLVVVPELGDRREAVAVEDGTTAFVIGGPRLPPRPGRAARRGARPSRTVGRRQSEERRVRAHGRGARLAPRRPALPGFERLTDRGV
jgi:hypothetical protein